MAHVEESETMKWLVAVAVLVDEHPRLLADLAAALLSTLQMTKQHGPTGLDFSNISSRPLVFQS